MKSLGLDLAEVQTFFDQVHGDPWVLVRVAPERTDAWTKLLSVPARRCYVSDARLKCIVDGQGHPYETVVKTFLPGTGSVMAGDYGEIMTALYLASIAHPEDVLEPKMWRLKSRRTKASEGSDVVQFQVPHWPTPSTDDRIVCAEVKTKSTNGNSTPVASALQDSSKDRKSRLATTLAWLKDRAIQGDLDSIKPDHLDRFLRAIDHPPANYEFRAVAVISTEYVQGETANITVPSKDECTLIVISVPDLKQNYENLYKLLLTTAAMDVRAP